LYTLNYLFYSDPRVQYPDDWDPTDEIDNLQLAGDGDGDGD
jgi:hypothetical protein